MFGGAGLVALSSRNHTLDGKEEPIAVGDLRESSFQFKDRLIDGAHAMLARHEQLERTKVLFATGPCIGGYDFENIRESRTGIVIFGIFLNCNISEVDKVVRLLAVCS